MATAGKKGNSNWMGANPAASRFRGSTKSQSNLPWRAIGD